MCVFSLLVTPVQLLDKVAGQKPQLTALELTLLSASVAAAASGPWLVGGKLTEFLAPTAAACKFQFSHKKLMNHIILSSYLFFLIAT